VAEEACIIIMISVRAAPSARVVVSQVVVTDLLSVEIVGPVRYPLEEVEVEVEPPKWSGQPRQAVQAEEVQAEDSPKTT
jgi:hypothetical protein